jgi:Immunity protein 70
MTLYLCIFDQDTELDGVTVGHYSDFGVFRDYIAHHLEKGARGSRFPTLMLHSDCDGEWTARECLKLKEELNVIQAELRRLPPVPLNSGWKLTVVKDRRLSPACALDSFFDVDGEPLVGRVLGLAELAIRTNRAILFQ